MPVLSESSISPNMSGAHSIYILYILAVLFFFTLLARHIFNLKVKLCCRRQQDHLFAGASKSSYLISALPGKGPLYTNLPTSSMQHHQISELPIEENDAFIEKKSHSAPTRLEKSGQDFQPPITRPPQLPPFKSGSNSAPSSLIHPDPPSPSIVSLSSMSPLKIQTGRLPSQTQFPRVQGQRVEYEKGREYQFPNSSPETPQEENSQQENSHNRMIFVPSPTEYTSFEALYDRNPPYHLSDAPIQFHSNQGTETDLPRRRSYTKSLSNGSEVSGEIVISNSSAVQGQQWRRHTKVFGGGKCEACEEGRRGSA